jgi:hypothetical protein
MEESQNTKLMQETHCNLDLRERFVDYALKIIRLSEALPETEKAHAILEKTDELIATLLTSIEIGKKEKECLSE